jgi:hypothetical protein
MEIESPLWRLKNQRCYCCDGEGFLCFSACPHCSHVILVCDEVDTVYPNPKDLTQLYLGDFADPSFVCPECGEVPVYDFRDATSDEIQRLGFLAGDYE